MIGVLGLQSSYSMLKSMIPLEELVILAKEAKYDFIALSDEQLHGTNDLYKLANKHSLKAILGMTIDVLEPNETSFIAYVKNNDGYKNLLKLSTLKANNHKFHIHDLINHQNGLIFVTNGYKSVIDQTILYGNKEIVNDYLKSYNNNFDDFYVGISNNHQIQKDTSSKYLYEVCINNNYKFLPLHETNYINIFDKPEYEALIRISNNNNKVLENEHRYFLDDELIKYQFKEYNNIFDNLKLFVNSINFSLNLPKFNLPDYQTPNGVDAKSYLKSLAKVGLKRRLEINKIKDDKKYINRLEHELETICNLSFENYFLIVYDFIKYAKDNKILVGPGRGSAAGSLVAYCLGITNVDPIKYDLLFERFLNPSRTSMPDIDVDFPDNKREEVINYVKEKYGNNHICSITTFSSFAIRSSVRDIVRVLDLPQSRATGIIQSALNDNYDKSDAEVLKVIKTAKKIEGLYRQTGTHAAGIVLSKEDLTKYIPMQQGAFDFNQAQFGASTLESLGLNKIDFLGIRNLTIISDVLDELKKYKIKIDINNIDLTDKKTFDLLSKGDTTGIFQLESPGMRKVLQKLKPKNFEDIVATLALYRPGPMENIDIYISRKNGENFEYYHKDLEPILNKTYGIIIYQEQIMQIAQAFAGYNLFDADMLRVGVSKKDLEILEKERTKFVTKSVELGRSKELANEIYDYIVRFADYGFNRSHSVSYGLVAYQMAYLKANYYSVFMKELLNTVVGNESQTSTYIQEARSNSLKVSFPDLRLSMNKYIINDKSLIMPLNSIKGFGNKIVNEIINNRKDKNLETFENVKTFLEPIISEVQFKNLIYSGALDYLGHNRKTLIENSDLKNLEYQKYIKDYQMKEVEDYSFQQSAEFEKSALGLNIKFNLFTLINEINPNKNKYKSISNINDSLNSLFLIGVIDSIKEYTNKNNEIMYFITITDGNSTIDVTVFSDVVNRYKNEFNDKISIFLVKKNTYQNKTSYILDNISNLKK